MGDVIRELEVFGKAFKAGVSNDIEWMWNEQEDPRDRGIKLPDSVAPTTEDRNIIDIDPEPDLFFPQPNPFSPPKDMRVSAPTMGNRFASGSVPAKPVVRHRRVGRALRAPHEESDRFRAASVVQRPCWKSGLRSFRHRPAACVGSSGVARQSLCRVEYCPGR